MSQTYTPPLYSGRNECTVEFRQEMLGVDTHSGPTNDRKFEVMAVSGESTEMQQAAETSAQAGRKALEAICRRITSTTPCEPSEIVPENTLQLYCAEMGRIALLKPEEEMILALQKPVVDEDEDEGVERRTTQEQTASYSPDLAELAMQQENGAWARDMFVQANLRLAVSMANKYKQKHGGSRVELEDLIQFGNEGLLRAVDKFDGDRGYKFSTYATWWIRKFFQDGVAEAENCISIPQRVHEQQIMIRAAANRLRGENSAWEPTDAELAEATKIPEDEVKDAQEHDYTMTSLDRLSSSEDKPASYGEMLLDGEANTEEEASQVVATEQQYNIICALMFDTLGSKARHIITRRYGMDGQAAATLEVISNEIVGKSGDIKGVSRETVRKIEKKGLQDLYKAATHQGLSTDIL